MRVLSPSEMIDMYTTSEVHFEPDNFTNALGLAEFMINEELQVEKRFVLELKTGGIQFKLIYKSLIVFVFILIDF